MLEGVLKRHSHHVQPDRLAARYRAAAWPGYAVLGHRTSHHRPQGLWVRFPAAQISSRSALF